MIVELYDRLLKRLGLSRYGRYAAAMYHLERIQKTGREKAIEGAFEGFHLFAESLNQQMEEIEAQKAIYFNTRCYRLTRDETGDGEIFGFSKPEDFMDRHLLLRFKRWLSVHNEKEARGESA